MRTNDLDPLNEEEREISRSERETFPAFVRLNRGASCVHVSVRLRRGRDSVLDGSEAVMVMLKLEIVIDVFSFANVPGRRRIVKLSIAIFDPLATPSEMVVHAVAVDEMQRVSSPSVEGLM